MLHIKTPEVYVSEPNAIHSLGLLVKKYSKRALIVWSKTSKKVAQEAIIESLGTQGIIYLEYVFEGYPTLDTANEIAQTAKANEVEIMIAVGGGRVMDVCKAAGDIAQILVGAVPTIAATCAPWAALSVMYDAEGNFNHFRRNEHSPRFVLADTSILIAAPQRYLKAGIVDTMAKWYETKVGFEEENSNFSQINSVNGAYVAYDFLDKKASQVLENAKRKQINKDTIKVVDSIIFLAGNVGSYVGEKAYSGFAHPFYHSARIIEETRDVLHGELVAFGLIMQAVLEKREQEEIFAMIEKFSELDVAFTLEEIGLEKQADKKLQIISNRIQEAFPNLLLLQDKKEQGAVMDAAYQADEYVKRYRKGQKKVCQA